MPCWLDDVTVPKLGHPGGEQEAQLPLFWQENNTFNALLLLAPLQMADVVKGRVHSAQQPLPTSQGGSLSAERGYGGGEGCPLGWA